MNKEEIIKFLREKEILKEGFTKWITTFPDGKYYNLVDLMEECATQQCAAKDAENEELKKVISEYQHHAITDPTNQKAEIDRLNKLLNDGFEDAYQAGFSDGSDCYKN